jgi:AcrR family transcriptional regulator
MAGFRALVRQGPTGLRAESLARDLKTTKGSFYWHFADVPGFRAELLALWATRAYGDVIAQLDDTASPPAKLMRLCVLAVSYRDPSYGGAALEPALRAWAREDVNVARAVAEMDARRVSYIKSLCLVSGLTNPDLPLLLYAASQGYDSLDGTNAGVIAAARGMRALLQLAGLPGEAVPRQVARIEV